MTDLVFLNNPQGNDYIGGGVLDHYPFAVMWHVPTLNSAQIPPLIAHEVGHVFGLLDTFNDPDLDKPAQGSMGYNYMDYVPVRKMFFKSQIKTMYNQQNLKK